MAVVLVGPLKAPVPKPGMTYHNGAAVVGGSLEEFLRSMRWSYFGPVPGVEWLWWRWGHCGMLSAPLVLLKNPSISNFVVRSHTVLPVVFLGSP